MDYNVVKLKFAHSRYRELTPGVGENCVIGKDVTICEGTEIRNNVVITGDVRIGRKCLIKSNTVIGEKGFGFAFKGDGIPVRITHTGGVIIGNYVEIGALNTIVGGTVEPTIIGDHVKTDDHAHIAHNCNIGEKNIITASVCFGGSVTTGKRCWFGLNSTIMNKAKIGDDCLIGIGAVVVKDVPENWVVVGNPAKKLRNNNA